MTEKEKMLAGMLYDPSDAELTELLIKARKLARQYNQIDEDEPEKRMAILRKLLPNSLYLPSLQAPVHFDYGCNTY
ncbi:MAG: sugar O-acetyltransferase, partial [Clostridia bacterium]|nr:sugar O-acetyltransferase [Clostridia bacterium]